MSKPLIGITPDRNDDAANIESHFFVRRNYCAAVGRGGGIPLILPYQPEAVERYLDTIDGLVVTGGMFDVDPAMYGMPSMFPGELTLKPDRTQFEQALLRGALARDLPVLGICGGMQLIAIEMGAQLFQHIPSEIDTDIRHKQSQPCSVGTHPVALQRDSRLRAVMGVDECIVNSLHHQAVMRSTPRLRVSALASDGVVEAVEVPGNTWCIGVQWHPEYGANPWDLNLFASLVEAAGKARQRKAQEATCRS